MKKRCLNLLGLMVLSVAGCHQGPYLRAHLDLLNAEKRAVEDAFYELEFDYEEACRELDKLRKENERLRGESGLPPRATRSNPSTRESTPSLSPPMVEEGSLIEPRIEIPSSPESRELPLPRSNTSPPAPPTIPPQSSRPEVNQVPVSKEVAPRTFSLEPADPRVTHIVLNSLLTAGSDFDRQPGDDGIIVVVEPRNRDDAFVPLAGPISVVLLDPAKTAEQGRIVARWDIDANDAQQALRNSPKVRGIELRLPWPASPPEIGRLHVHVRYMTMDNRDLRADRPLFIQLPGQVMQSWTPRASKRGESSNLSSNALPPSVAPPNLSAPRESPIPFHARPVTETESISEGAANGLAAPRASPVSQAARPQWRPQR